MRRTKKQLNAISRAYYQKRFKEQAELIAKYGLQEVFKQSKYKNMTWFITWAKSQELIPLNESI